MQKNKKIHLMSIACTVCIGLLYLFLSNKAYILLTIESPETQQLQLFWKSKDQAYSEERSKITTIHNSQWRYLLYFDSLDKIDTIRIDPANVKGARVRFVNLSIGQMGLRNIEIYSKGLSNIRMLQNVSKTDLRDNTVLFRSNSEDPALEIKIPKIHLNRLLKFFEYMLLGYVGFWLLYLLLIDRRNNNAQS